MLLKNLIKEVPKKFKTIEINDLALDSRRVKRGSLFFALKGDKFNGEKFIYKATKKGAKAVICSLNFESSNLSIPIIKVKNVKKTLSLACSKFFKKKPENIIAVTGTNGKSSVADFFYQILSLNNIPVASIGTLGIKKKKIIKKLRLTSPDIISLHRELAELKKSKINHVILEASSHGLEQGRLNGINFKAGIFTNFTQDHLDYHKNMEKYFNSKMILFSKLLQKKKFVITDNSLSIYPKIENIAKKNKLKIISIDKNLNKNINIPEKIIGNFQIKNLSMAIIAARLCKIKNNKIFSKLKKISAVEGRLELIKKFPNGSKIFIDYAHTPDALTKVLQSLKNHYNQNITLVFGCGGERDTKKRRLMAKVAKKYSKNIYVTDDNPRNENPKNIRKTIIKYLNKKNYTEIGNRAKAIKTAVLNAQPFEIILIAGKGHETEQDYGNKTIKTSDKLIIKKIKYNKKKINSKQFNFIWNSRILKKVLNKNKFFKFRGITINSKEVKKDNLFIAIKGKNKDGHDYVKEAISKKVSYCIVSKKLNKFNNKKILNVKNTNNFLKKIAIAKRLATGAKLVAVTGSAGKTTVKTILGRILNNYADTYFSPKSFNNHYGVPISLSNLESNHKYGVFEVGMSKKGEISTLSNMVKPDIAIITNIAEAHIENFNSLKDISKAKGEIISNIKNQGTLIINRDDKFYHYFNKLAKIKKIKTISFGRNKKSDIYPIYEKKKKIFKIKVLDEEITLNIKNINIYNTLSILAVLKVFNLDLKKSIKYFQLSEQLAGRGKFHYIFRYKTHFNLIDESYNANPLSVKNAIINLSNIKKKNFKKYVLLGDMLELGNKSNFYHKNLSQIINNTDIDKVFVYGDKVLATYKHIKKSKKGSILRQKKEFDDIFSKIIKKGDYLMVKGSNATGLNEITNNIIKGAINVI